MIQHKLQQNRSSMETIQDSIQFPTPQLQEQVSKLWDKVHEVKGTVNFLMERNKELKNKLDEKPDIVSVFSESNEDKDKLIDELRLEVLFLKTKVSELEAKVNIDDLEISRLSVLALNYHKLISSYDRIKKFMKVPSQAPFLPWRRAAVRISPLREFPASHPSAPPFSTKRR